MHVREYTRSSHGCMTLPALNVTKGLHFPVVIFLSSQPLPPPRQGKISNVTEDRARKDWG